MHLVADDVMGGVRLMRHRHEHAHDGGLVHGAEHLVGLDRLPQRGLHLRRLVDRRDHHVLARLGVPAPRVRVRVRVGVRIRVRVRVTPP